jgi:hypothetical protein
MILKGLEEAVLSGEVGLPEAQDGEPIPEIAKVREVLGAGIESQLNRLARLGLL